MVTLGTVVRSALIRRVTEEAALRKRGLAFCIELMNVHQYSYFIHTVALKAFDVEVALAHSQHVPGAFL